MNSVNQIQIQRFKRLFPELPSELAGVVLLYGGTAEFGKNRTLS